MDIGLRSLVLMILIPCSLLFAGSLRKKTESGELKVSPVRLLIFATVFGAIYVGGIAAPEFLSDAPMFDEGRPDAFSLALHSVGIGLYWAVFFLVISRRRYLASFRFKTFRTTSMYGAFLASFFSFIYLLFIFDSASMHPLILFFSTGVLGGAVWGATELRASKRRVVGDKMIVPMPFSDRGRREMWKAYLIMIIVGGASLLLSRMVFDSKDAWMGSLGGMFLGMVTYQLVWVLLYEKRNNVRLVFEYSEPNQPVESKA